MARVSIRFWFTALFSIVLSGCYASHGIEESYGSDDIVGTAGVPAPDLWVEAVLDEAASLEELAVVEDMAMAATVEGNPELDLEDEFHTPILYDATPRDGCTNRDIWIELGGAHIHWLATVTIVYPYDGGQVVIAEQRDVCNQLILDWTDLSMIRFRTRQDLEWTDGGGYHSGDYLVSVTNPDGQVSNEVGLSLQWCDDSVEEVSVPCQ